MSYLFDEIGIHRCFACLSRLASAIKSSAFVFIETFGLLENLEKKNFMGFWSTFRKS